MTRSHPEDDPRPEHSHQAGAETVDAADERAALLRRDGRVGELLKLVMFAVLLDKGLHDGNACQCLLNVRLDATFDFAFQLRRSAQPFANQEGGADHERREKQ